MEYFVSNPLADREIVIAVGGGIAAYKVAAIDKRTRPAICTCFGCHDATIRGNS